jgi:ACR3 family arsenite efflux pump ArsB
MLYVLLIVGLLIAAPLTAGILSRYLILVRSEEDGRFEAMSQTRSFS